MKYKRLVKQVINLVDDFKYLNWAVVDKTKCVGWSGGIRQHGCCVLLAEMKFNVREHYSADDNDV